MEKKCRRAKAYGTVRTCEREFYRTRHGTAAQLYIEISLNFHIQRFNIMATQQFFSNFIS